MPETVSVPLDAPVEILIASHKEGPVTCLGDVIGSVWHDHDIHRLQNIIELFNHLQHVMDLPEFTRPDLVITCIDQHSASDMAMLPRLKMLLSKATIPLMAITDFEDTAQKNMVLDAGADIVLHSSEICNNVAMITDIVVNFWMQPK